MGFCSIITNAFFKMRLLARRTYNSTMISLFLKKSATPATPCLSRVSGL